METAAQEELAPRLRHRCIQHAVAAELRHRLLPQLVLRQQAPGLGEREHAEHAHRQLLLAAILVAAVQQPQLERFGDADARHLGVPVLRSAGWGWPRSAALGWRRCTPSPRSPAGPGCRPRTPAAPRYPAPA